MCFGFIWLLLKHVKVAVVSGPCEGVSAKAVGKKEKSKHERIANLSYEPRLVCKTMA